MSDPDVLVERQLGHFLIKHDGSIEAVCGWCRRITYIYTGLDQDHTLQRIDDWLLNGKSLRDVLSMVTDEDREVLESGTCEHCWGEMFRVYETSPLEGPPF